MQPASDNKIYQPALIVLGSLLALFGLSFLPSFNSPFGDTKRIALFSDIEKDTAVMDSSLAVNDSLLKKDTLFTQDPTAIIDYQNDSALIPFFQSLAQTHNGKKVTRIAWFGDSFIEGDLITQDFRSLMQDAFGGNGVGFVPVTSIVAGFRQSVIHRFSGWTTLTLLDPIPEGHSLGMSGYTFLPWAPADSDTTVVAGAPTVHYHSVPLPHLNGFNTVKLLYGNSKGNNFVTINNTTYPLNNPGIINEVRISGENVQNVNATFQCASSVDIYGFSLENDNGVVVDNFSFRGNSGLPLSKVTTSMYTQTNALLGYDLIILEYGINAISPKSTNYDWYARGMNSSIKYLKSCFPNTSLLLIGIGDKAVREKGEYIEDPAIAPMLTIQRNMAIENKCAYWSLYNAMGGSGSMIQWVKGDTAFANLDYTHLNAAGAKKVGGMFYTKLMEKYQAYLKRENL